MAERLVLWGKLLQKCIKSYVLMHEIIVQVCSNCDSIILIEKLILSYFPINITYCYMSYLTNYGQKNVHK